jgi:diguanylate cyclase (GGDEF)-like protein
MSTLSKGKIFRFKATAFIFTLILVILYDYFPNRVIDLHPNLTQHVDESVDSAIGGNSKLTWLDRENMHWVCELKEGAPYPYCGISIAWSAQPFKQIDFSNYDALEINLEYEGQARYLRVFLRNYYPLPNNTEEIRKAKFNSISKSSKDFQHTTNIPFDQLRVADWWIEENHIPPENIKPDVSKVIAVGIDIPHPNIKGLHEFKLKGLRAVGGVISKESFYLAIIIFWAILLLVDMYISQMKLRTKVESDGQQLQKLKEKSAIYQEKAEHDKLTGILNREGLNRLINELFSTHLLHQYTLLVVDLDYFKQVNDEHGHIVGDKVLQEVAEKLKNTVRSYDIVSRWGGEEFVILFHCMDSDSIQHFAEKIRQKIEFTSFVNGKFNHITISVGATNIALSETFEQAFIRADRALYEAKEKGRNRTVVNL